MLIRFYNFLTKINDIHLIIQIDRVHRYNANSKSLKKKEKLRTSSQHPCWYHTTTMYKYLQIWLYLSLYRTHVFGSATLITSKSLIKSAVDQMSSFNQNQINMH